MEGLWRRSISPVLPITIGSSGDTLTHNTLSKQKFFQWRIVQVAYMEEARVTQIIVAGKGKNEREEEE